VGEAFKEGFYIEGWHSQFRILGSCNIDDRVEDGFEQGRLEGRKCVREYNGL